MCQEVVKVCHMGMLGKYQGRIERKIQNYGDRRFHMKRERAERAKASPNGQDADDGGQQPASYDFMRGTYISGTEVPRIEPRPIVVRETAGPRSNVRFKDNLVPGSGGGGDSAVPPILKNQQSNKANTALNAIQSQKAGGAVLARRNTVDQRQLIIKKLSESL